MSAFLQTISLFSESRFWRVKGQATIQENFGGMASLLLFLIVGVVFAIKMADVFKRSKVLIESQQMIGTTTLEAAISTDIHNPDLQPTMLAFKANSLYYTMNTYYTDRNGTETLTLQNCQYSHFPGVQNIELFFTIHNLSTYSCLPLGRSFNLGGGRYPNQFNFIQTAVDCKPGQNANYAQNNIGIVVLSSAVNPGDHSQPWLKYINRYYYTGSGKSTHLFRLQENTLISKNGLFLSENKQTSKGFQLSSNIEVLDSFTGGNAVNLNFLFTNSEKKFIYSRSYQTVLDGLSYMGGIFNALLAGFFFMKIYGQVFFEMFFAHLYFKTQEASSFGFFAFLKQLVFNVLSALGCKPQWEFSEKRERMRDTVKNMMNVVYLQRRVDFLEKSITILLERHHLKGLHLLHRLTKKEADENFRGHGFRDRLIGYFRQRHRQDGTLGGAGEQPPIKRNIESASNLKEEGRKGEKVEKLELDKTPEISEGKKLEPGTSETGEDYFQDYEEVELSPMEIEEDLQKDLKLLMQEAEGSGGDQRSRRIVEQFDRQIKDWIREALREAENEYRFQFNLAD